MIELNKVIYIIYINSICLCQVSFDYQFISLAVKIQKFNFIIKQKVKSNSQVNQNFTKMSIFRPLQNSISDFTRQQYMHYLQDQLQNFSSFMIFQKKQNEKHHHLNRIVEGQNQKIKFLNDKVLLVQLYQNQNLKNHEKLFQSSQKAISIQKRVDKLENILSDQRTSSILNNNFCQSNKEQAIKREIIFQMDRKLKCMQKQFSEQINYLRQTLDIEIINNQNVLYKQANRKTMSKENLSPLQTNCSQNGISRLKDFDKQALKKKQINKIQKRINSFVNQRLLKLQDQLNTKYEDQAQTVSHYNSMKTNEKLYEPQRSPISSYLKRQNQYFSNQQNADSRSREISSKSSYLIGRKDTCKNKKKRDKQSKSRSNSKSKSKSRSKSNRSLLKEQSCKQVVSRKLKNILQVSNNKRISAKRFKQTIDKDQRKQTGQYKKDQKIKKKDQSKLSIKSKDLLNLGVKQQRSNKMSKRKSQQTSISRLSELSKSQTSIISRSKSKQLSKSRKNQKQYQMRCNKMH